MLKLPRILLPILLLATAVLPALRAQPRVINNGFPGENTAQLDARLDPALQSAHPSYVVLFAGANDALNDRQFLSSRETAAHLSAMVSRIEASGAKALLVTVHDPDLTRLMQRHKPEVYGSQPPLERLARVNAAIRRTARQSHATLVPFAAVLRRAGGANLQLSTDGVHLTAKGYGLLATAVLAKLPRSLSQNTTILCFGDSLTYGIGVRPPNDSEETPETYPAQLRALILQSHP